MIYNKELKQYRTNYEKNIAQLRESLKKTERLLNAALEYIDGSTARGTLAEMIGELYTEKIKIEGFINDVIKRHEIASKITVR